VGRNESIIFEYKCQQLDHQAGTASQRLEVVGQQAACVVWQIPSLSKPPSLKQKTNQEMPHVDMAGIE
jgi:hypothetical protein